MFFTSLNKANSRPQASKFADIPRDKEKGYARFIITGAPLRMGTENKTVPPENSVQPMAEVIPANELKTPPACGLPESRERNLPMYEMYVCK